MSEIATEDRRAYLVCDKRIDEVVKDGIDIAEIDRKLLQKIERLKRSRMSKPAFAEAMAGEGRTDTLYTGINVLMNYRKS